MLNSYELLSNINNCKSYFDELQSALIMLKYWERELNQIKIDEYEALIKIRLQHLKNAICSL